MQQLYGHSDRTLLPRGLLGRRVVIYTAGFRFEVGAAVLFHGEPATVRDRIRSTAGREIYDITLECADRPHRTVRGEFLASDDNGRKTRNRRVAVRETEGQMRILPEVHPVELFAA